MTAISLIRGSNLPLAKKSSTVEQRSPLESLEELIIKSVWARGLVWVDGEKSPSYFLFSGDGIERSILR